MWVRETRTLRRGGVSPPDDASACPRHRLRLTGLVEILDPPDQRLLGPCELLADPLDRAEDAHEIAARDLGDCGVATAAPDELGQEMREAADILEPVGVGPP